MSQVVWPRRLGIVLMGFDTRTSAALGNELMDRLSSLQFCIVGCGGTGANFAEMLVRTGTERLVLVDGGCVKDSTLNRVFGFTAQDVGRPKVEVLERRLRAIGRPGIEISALYDNFRAVDQLLEGNTLGQRVRDAVHDADVVFVATDTNTSRLELERLCREKDQGMLLCCGVRVDREAGVYEFECAWSPKTPDDQAGVQGYGPENASFASIVVEATSVAFTMLLSNLRDEKHPFRYYRRKYDASFTPVETCVSEISSGSTREYPKAIG